MCDKNVLQLRATEFADHADDGTIVVDLLLK